MRFRAASACWVAGLVASTCPSQAQTPPVRPWVQVIDIQSTEAVAQAQAVTVALKRELGRPIDAGFVLEPLLRDASCNGVLDTPCLGRVALRVDADQFVWGSAKRGVQGKVVVDLHMYSRGDPQRYTELLLDETLVDPSSPALQRQVQAALAALITRGGPATVRVRFGHLDGQILVDGRPATELRSGLASLSVRAGEHQIEIRSSGQPSQTRSFFVQPGSTTELVFEPLREESDRPPPAPINWHKNIGWGSIGLGAVFTGLGFYSGLKVASVKSSADFEEYKNYTTGDVCDAAENDVSPNSPTAAAAARTRDKCATGEKYVTLEYIFLGAALVSFTTGIVLLSTAPSPKSSNARSLQLFPSVGKQGASLGARFDF